MWKKKSQNQKEEQFVRNKLRFLFPVFLLLVSPVFGSHHFTFNKNLLVAQKQNYELRLGRAEGYILTEQEVDPENSAVHYLLHLNAFLKAFVSETEADYAAYRKIQDNALFHFEQLPDSSPFKRFAQSEVYFYSATLKAKFDELYSAARDVNKAHSLIEENHKEFPDFLPNNKTRGVIKVYLSTVPENYEWIINMLGIKGDLNGGLRLLKTLTTYQKDTTELSGIAKEAAYLYSFTLLHVAKQGGKAWSETLKCTDDYKTSLLSSFFIKSCLQKMSWHYFVIGENEKGVSYKSLISKKGYALNEEDKQSQRYASKPSPHAILLESRLLYDGGYYELANKSIARIEGKNLENAKLKAEFCYRRGRLAEKMGEMDAALKLYEAASLFAIDSDEYYGAYASIYLGDYHLRNKDMELARKFYKRALGFKENREYTESIEQRAKAGLKKIK